MPKKIWVGDEDNICGISRIWALPEDHPFTAACIGHDQAFVDYKRKGSGTFSSVNKKFYKQMINRANEEKGFKRFWLKTQAVIMFNIANSPIGYYYWKRK